MNKNCFLKGVMTGKMLKVRHTGTASSATAGVPSSVADYDKESFLSGLAVGMSTCGVLHWPAVASIIATRASSTDEMLMELYLMDKLGTLQVPKLPGMTRLQAWMEENNFTDISQYAAAKEAFGGAIAWEHYRREIIETAYDDSTAYPVEKSNSLLGPKRYQFGKEAWWYYNGASDIYPALSERPTIKKSENKISVTYTTGDNELYCANIEGNGCLSYYADNLPLGKYRLTFVSATMSPEPERYENLDPFIGVDSSAGDNSSEHIVVRPGESKDINVTTFEKHIPLTDFGTSKTEYHQAVLNFWFSRFKYNSTISVSANTSYTYTFEFRLELIEKLPYESNDHASLTDVLEIADAINLYYLSSDNGQSIKPLLMIDQNEQWLRDRDKVCVTGGKVYPDIRYAAKNIVQTNTENAITVDANLVNDTYVYTFSSSEMPVGSAEYRINASSATITLYGSEIGDKGSKPYNLLNLSVRRRDGG